MVNLNTAKEFDNEVNIAVFKLCTNSFLTVFKGIIFFCLHNKRLTICFHVLSIKQRYGQESAIWLLSFAGIQTPRGSPGHRESTGLFST